MEKRYHKITGEKAAAIIADHHEKVRHILDTLTRLTGVPVENAERTGALAFGIADVVGAYSDTPPTEPGWQPDKRKRGLYVPSKRTKAGKAITAELEKLDALGLLGALKRAGVDPWPKRADGWPGSPAGHGFVGSTVLLVTGSDWAMEWPEWVETIKASEFYAIQEAEGQATT